MRRRMDGNGHRAAVPATVGRVESELAALTQACIALVAQAR
jgi:hypothetical protein